MDGDLMMEVVQMDDVNGMGVEQFRHTAALQTNTRRLRHS